MEAKDKAKELVNKFINVALLDDYESKQCALISVDEIIRANPHSNPFNTDVHSTMEYWQQVKNQINLL